jgi:ferredoxin
MRVAVDRDRCQGHVRCEAAAPGMFVFDENGNNDSDGMQIPLERLEEARRAVAACPERAITFDD